jgi:signal transduction histidine kinase
VTDEIEQGRRARILAADDNEQNRTLVRMTLEGEGYDVETVTDGTQAVAAFEARRHDCVLLDIRMPVLDGFEACRQIRALPGGDQTPILFLTALREVDAFDSALRAGGDDFLTKPVRPTELIVRVQSAVKLSRLGSKLSDHVAIVRKQRDDLMRLQLQQERLMSFVVHDLKNPVGAIDLQAQSLLRARELPERARKAAEHIRSDARNLIRLILNLLDIAKSEEGQLVAHKTAFDLPALVDDIFDAMQIAARANGVRLAGDFALDPPNVCADADLLRRMLENLIDNAIRHTPEGGIVTVRAARADTTLELYVSDTGAGIAPQLVHKIFEKYVQVEQKSGAVSRTGRGLGLAFCQLAAQAHGGSIVVETTASGACFCIRLPDAR